jgi:hypothetical protein
VQTVFQVAHRISTSVGRPWLVEAVSTKEE